MKTKHNNNVQKHTILLCTGHGEVQHNKAPRWQLPGELQGTNGPGAFCSKVPQQSSIWT